jgi:hypothetical protein
MASLTNDGEKLVLNALFRNTGTLPTNIYVGLATNPAGSLDETVQLADLTEVDDAGYERKESVFTAPVINGDSYEIENSAQIEFGPWAENEDIGITYAFLCDVASGTTGIVLGLYHFSSVKMPLAGEAQIITQGSCTFSID